VVEEAVRKDEWTKVESEARPRGSRPPANYRVRETSVTLYGKDYRAVVVHSDAHDKRRQKKLERMLSESIEEAGASSRRRAGSSTSAGRTRPPRPTSSKARGLPATIATARLSRR
jgi:hypothetical protein